ncbi:MAG: copper-transporting ATPase [Actinobacteria bacterium]|uniref:Unannotated protein n=1 Tax=freshwater metagenome TaxID=449393 RepID=A0A6J7DLC2_9ZZZZ|nr:heavy-metal-associated domain-containing protein [Actinomycetota bacterium]MSW47754.1 copper-transporting ATPase [Actinomycetota bacterium]MSX25179.1 copper-transporting ATPase [Actinomycetota bacterium]MSY46978.1 copper-transporting ATPase [Actinomycetota bacterium]MSY57555.1 copper-transporting ATPase [Actinomycetota bacterium]
MATQTINIKGMTCGHCEGRVTAEFKKIAGVTEVIASAEQAHAIVTSESDLDATAIESAVRAAGYTLA